MPTYDYVCDACGHEFELFQSISEPVKRKCPKCGRQKLRRLIGAGAAVMFKGSGFYQTDYRSDKYKERAAADKPPSESVGGDKSSSEKSGSDKSSSDKPAAKSETSATAKSDGKPSASKSSSKSSGKKN